MQTTSLRPLCTLALLLLFLLKVYGSFQDVTSKVGVSSANGLVAAFGDFNGDKSTDLFVIKNQGTQLYVYLWNQGSQKFDSSISLVEFASSVAIVNVAPGDFDGDGCMDILITTEAGKPDARNIQPKKVYVFWGNLEKISKVDKAFKITEELKDQPVILDVNGDLIPDFFGTIYDKNNASREVRTYFVSVGKNRTFEAQTQKPNSKAKEVNPGSLDPLRIPHSNGFLDLTGDMTADLFVTSKTEKSYHFEIWENKGGVLTYSPEVIGLPDGVTASSHVIGQSSFADFDRDGKIDHLLPVCTLPNCENSEIYAYINKKWSKILASNHKLWQFIPPSSNDSIPNIPLMTLRIGDYNLDGYPDGLIILDIAPRKIKRAPVLLQNVPCGEEHNCVNGRTFSVQWKSLMSLEGAVLATFFDLFENGITDFIIVTQTKNGQFRLHAIRNNLYVDASFVKVVVLGGATITSCSSDKLPYGVNQAGPYISYTVTDNDGKLKTGGAAQLSQSGYYALQCPYTVFGLGRTPNFVDKLTIGMPRAKDGPVRSHSWPSIIPNSQMIVIPYPANQPNEWKSKLLVTPSKLVLLTALCLVGLCAVLALIIMVLHLLEKRADQKEKREDAHKFHFDAM